MSRPTEINDTEMRYLYHLTEGNRGPVTFEQLQELAKAGTIDNMTPILAEGAREWSRWLFIKDAPPAPAPKPTPAPAAAPAPVPQKKAEPKAVDKPAPKPAPTPAPKTEPTPEPKPAPAPKAEKPAAEAKPAPVATPEQAAKPEPAPVPAPKPAAAPAPSPRTPEVLPAEETPADAPAKPFNLRASLNELNLLHLIPAGVCALITLLSLIAAGIWSFMAHDTREEYAKLRDMQAEHSQSRADLDEIAAQQQQVIAENTKLQADILALQQTLQLTKEESERLAKGPYISEAEAKQLKEEQAKAARLKEQEQKN